MLNLRYNIDKLFLDPSYGFYFAPKDGLLRYGDDRKVEVGKMHSVGGKIRVCNNGLHGSIKLIDACKYAPGPKLYFVRFDGTISHTTDKLAARHRTYLKEINFLEHITPFIENKLNEFNIKSFLSTKEIRVLTEFMETNVLNFAVSYNLPYNLNDVLHSLRDLRYPDRTPECIGFDLHHTIHMLSKTICEICNTYGSFKETSHHSIADEFQSYIWEKENLNDYIKDIK